MAARVGVGPRFAQLIGDAALFLRVPARAVFGSLRSAIFFFTLVLTTTLIVQFIYLGYGYRFGDTVQLLVLVALLSNVALVYGAMNDKLEYVYGWMSFSILRLPLILLCGIGAQYYTIAIGLPLCILHLAGEVILLALAHGHAHEQSRGGWLHANMAAQGDARADVALQPSLGSGPCKSLQAHSPAVLAPSVCTTAPPATIATNAPPVGPPHYQC